MNGGLSTQKKWARKQRWKSGSAESLAPLLTPLSQTQSTGQSTVQNGKPDSYPTRQPTSTGTAGKMSMKQIEQNKTEVDNAKRLYSGAKDKQTSAEQKSTRDIARREFVMVTLWERMSDIFGNVWAQNYGIPGGRSMQTWTAGLANYSENQIRMGVMQSKKWSENLSPDKYASPPNLGQFAKLCLTKAPGPKSTHKALEAPRTDSVRQAEILRQAEVRAGRNDETKAESMEKLGLHARWGQ
jgi:hypothetical protein